MNSIFFVLSKIGGVLLSPGTVLLLMLCFGFGLLFTRFQKKGSYLLAQRYPNARILFSGGSGLVRYPNLREADFARTFFTNQRLPEYRVFFESASRNTFENAVNTRQLVDPKPEESWVLVTSAAHMPRSIGAFCEQNWAVIPWPVDHHTSPSRRWRLEFDFAGNLSTLESAIHEYTGLIMYRITGKTPQLLPTNCKAGD